MKRAQKIAEENRKQEICVTYDLAIAKIAHQLQEEEVPKFDNVFFALGGFHIEMAAFAVFGKYIAKSGGPDILNECHHCVKSVQIRSYFWSAFSLFGLNTEIYEVNLRIQSE